MGGVRWVREAIAKDPGAARSVRRAVHSWRETTEGVGAGDARRGTLLACSGGADSTALALALASASTTLVVGHVVHDLREATEALADRDAARDLANRLGLAFAEASIAVRSQPGNAEANARRLRYAALARLAREHACPFVAAAHHADDQLETVLMRLLRGAGPRGLGGMARRRVLSRAQAGASPEVDVWLIRPMLGLTRDEARSICAACAATWGEDRTNRDTTRLRAAIRHELVPVLRRIAPGAASHVGVAAELVAQAGELARDEAMALLERGDRLPHEFRWARGVLRAHKLVVLGELVALAAWELCGPRGADRLSFAAVRPALLAMGDTSTQPREFGLHAVQIAVDAHQVTIRVRS